MSFTEAMDLAIGSNNSFTTDSLRGAYALCKEMFEKNALLAAAASSDCLDRRDEDDNDDKNGEDADDEGGDDGAGADSDGADDGADGDANDDNETADGDADTDANAGGEKYTAADQNGGVFPESLTDSGILESSGEVTISACTGSPKAAGSLDATSESPTFVKSPTDNDTVEPSENFTIRASTGSPNAADLPDAVSESPTFFQEPLSPSGSFRQKTSQSDNGSPINQLLSHLHTPQRRQGHHGRVGSRATTSCSPPDCSTAAPVELV
jgi:hypothetical protein